MGSPNDAPQAMGVPGGGAPQVTPTGADGAQADVGSGVDGGAGPPAVEPARRTASPRSRSIAALLALLFGTLGVHRFYVGKVVTGILMILTLGGLGLWVLVDLVVILVGRFRDKQGRVLSNW